MSALRKLGILNIGSKSQINGLRESIQLVRHRCRTHAKKAAEGVFESHLEDAEKMSDLSKKCGRTHKGKSEKI